MKDFLAADSSADFGGAVLRLAQAVTANARGDASYAAAQARLAEQAFRRAGNEAGEARSRFEEVYAFHRFAQGDRCLRAASELQSEIVGKPYPWLISQVLLEISSCSGMLGDLGKSEEAADRALKYARTSNYEVLYLRSLGFLAADETVEGNWPASWARNFGRLGNAGEGASRGISGGHRADGRGQ